MKSQKLNLESVFAIIIAFSGVILFTSLLTYDKIGSISYVTLLSVLGLISLVLHGFSRIRKLDLKNLRMTLDRIEEVKAEVFAKEADLKNITISLAKIIAFSNAFQGRWGSEEGNELQRNWHRLQTNKLLDRLTIEPEARAEILKYDSYFQMTKNLKTIEEKEKFRDGLFDMVRKDLANATEQEPSTKNVS